MATFGKNYFAYLAVVMFCLLGKHRQHGIKPHQRASGNETWRSVAYTEHPQGNLFGGPDLIKMDNDTVANAFADRLKRIAGFEYVATPLPMRNSNNAIVYYLFFASQKPIAQKIITNIFDQYR